MRAALLDLISALAIHHPPIARPRPFIPLRIRALDIEFADHQREHDLKLQLHQPLTDTVSWPEFKGPPGALDRGVSGVFRAYEPAVGEELERADPVLRVPLQGLVEDPDILSLGRVAIAVFVDEVDACYAGAGGGCAGEEALCLFEDGRCVGELVEQMGLGGEQVRETGEVGAEDGVVLGADASQGFGVGG